jgi:hypothetical protein
MFPFECQCHLVSLQLKHDTVFPLYLALNGSFRIFPLFCILFVYMVLFLQDISTNFYDVSHDACLARVFNMNTVFN